MSRPHTIPQRAPSGPAQDRWFVTNGVVAIGPVDFRQLRRATAEGRIPASAFVRHASWRVWQRWSDLEALAEGERSALIARLAELSAACSSAEVPRLSEPPPMSPLLPLSGPPTSHPPLSSVRPAAVDPVGVLARAADLDDGLLLALSTSVAAANADVGLLHRQHQPSGVVLTSFVQGPRSEALLGEQLREDDPVVLAARSGYTLLAEPELGQAGRCVVGRLSRCLGSVRGAAMVPLQVYGKLVAVLELGRASTAFRAREVARVEDVIDALTGRVVVMGWLDGD